MQVTDEELEAVARATALANALEYPEDSSGYRSIPEYGYCQSLDDYVETVWEEFIPLARAAITAYNATPGQVQMREDSERWRQSVTKEVVRTDMYDRAEDNRELERLRTAIDAIIREPPMPFPDPGAHSWETFGKRVYSAWANIQQLARAARAAEGES